MADAHNPNPFASPAVDSPRPVQPVVSVPQSEEELLAAASRKLKQARFWIWFSGIMLILLAWIVILGTIFLVVVRRETNQLANHLVTIFIYGISGILVMRFHGKIGKFLRVPEPAELKDLYEAESSYWKFLGMVTLASIVLVLLLIVVGVSLSGLAGGGRPAR